MKSIPAIVLAFAILLPAGLVWYRLRPIVIERSYSPSPTYKSYIDIVEIPRTNSLGNFITSLLNRDDPLYRFELHGLDGYLWSAATYNTSSYKAQKGKVVWEAPGRAKTFLDDSPRFELVGDLWRDSE
jgi:hypothetical protein